MRKRVLKIGSIDKKKRNLALSGILPILLLLALIAFMRGYSSAQAQISAQGIEKVGLDVVETLRSEGQVRVVIALASPSSISTQPPSLNRLRNEVAYVQNSVLASVDPADFTVSHQYQAVPALAGTVLTESGLAALAADPYVRKIDLDVGGTGGLGSTVPLIGADTWHSAGNRGSGVVAAVLDSGMDSDHSDLAAALIHQACFLDNDGAVNGSGLCPNGSDRQIGPGAAEDDAGHGTHVTGIIASRGNRSSVGVAPGASIVAIKVTAGPSFSGVFYSFSEIVAALDYIINNRPDVQIINMSLVTNAQFTGDCDNSTSWTMAGASAINTLRSLGVVSFASAGNNGSGTSMAAPACLSNVISVGATDNSDAVASFSDSNSATDIMAPGVGVLSSNIGDGTFTASGTSMASPHAAGCAALLIAAQEAVTPDQIEARLESSPVQVFNFKNERTYPRIECSLKPVAEVTTSGLSIGLTGDEHPFTATVGPIIATLPINYSWQATGQSPLLNTGGISDTVSFIWDTPGEKVISVTAENFAGSVSTVHTITIDAPQTGIDAVEISGPAVGFAGNEHAYIATVNPPTATLPISYKWEATGQTPLFSTGGISDTVSFTWDTPGEKVISVTAENIGSKVSTSFSTSILAGFKIELPIIVK